MGSYMYRQRPNLVALGGALIVFISGILVYCMQLQNSGGHLDQRVRLMILLGTPLLTVVLLLIAFARYRFTHLWRKKHKGRHDKSLRKHDRHSRHSRRH
ncbi:hypothetical protein [Pontiella sp.]|uniref:hypothetical protein n=1 Tax=Pontiella sp. TaxID=2837462 RepID=UPI003561D0A2